MGNDRTASVTGEMGARFRVRLYRFRTIAKRYWWVLFLTLGLGTLLAGWMAYRQPVRFISVGKLNVREAVGGTADPNWIATIAATIASPTNLERANQNTLREQPGREGLLGSVAIAADHEPGTYIVAIHGRGGDAAFTQSYVGHVMRAFIEQRREAVLAGWREQRKYEALQGEAARAAGQIEKGAEVIEPQPAVPAPTEKIDITQEASTPIPESRHAVAYMIVGLSAGLLVGLMLLLVLDRADDRLASSSEMMEQFSEPILGQIPDVASSRSKQGLPLLQDDDERYIFAEAFRSLRSSLIFMPNQSELKTLIITSAIPNEGKSTLASNLAITMANAGARVLLVDADLRRGDIASLFDTDGRQGLSNILRGEVRWNACVQEVRPGRLDVIPRGPVTNQSSELLLRPIVPKLLAEWKATYDLVLFNTAPILATDDTPTLAPAFDGTLMVIRASFTSARLTRNALNALYQRQVNVLGLIMNCVDTELPDYYYYRYPKYYAA